MSIGFDLSAPIPAPTWLQSKRDEAVRTLSELGVPTDVEELWRYSRINDLDLSTFTAAPSEVVDSPDGMTIAPEGAVAITTIDGNVAEISIPPALVAQGLRVASLNGAADLEAAPDNWGTVVRIGDYFVTANTANAPDPLVIQIPQGAIIEAPIHITHVMKREQSVSFPRVFIHAAEASQATIYEHFVSADRTVAALVVPVTELIVDQAANVTYVALQELGTDVWQMATQASRVDRDANFTSTSVALGGSYARIATDSQLVGLGANSKLQAMFFGSDGQMHDFRTWQDHRAPKTTSDLLFKGAVGTGARSVYSGLIRVERGASGTNAYQTNRNLVLSENSHADSVPNLEIEENDVRCSHASAVGPVDEEQLYYLESRGVPTDTARRLIVLGFLSDATQYIPSSGLVRRIREHVATKLASIEAGK